MPVLPGSNYIGPGNPVENGPPQNDVDRLAAEHDSGYAAARTPEEIRKLDRYFLEQVAKVKGSSLTEVIHKYIAYGGISVKEFAENYLGVLYPRFTAGTMPIINPETHESFPYHEYSDEVTMEESQMESPSSTVEKTASKGTKKRKMGEELSPPADGSGQSGQSGISQIFNVPRSRITHFNGFKTMKTFDFEIVTFLPNKTFKNVAADNTAKWVAPMYDFFVAQLGWYLNKGELNFLKAMPQMNMVIERVKGDIKIGSINSGFVTAAATSSQSAANTHVNICLFSGKGLEYHYLLESNVATITYNTTAGQYEVTAIAPGNTPTNKFSDWDITSGALNGLPATQAIQSYKQVTSFPLQLTAGSTTDSQAICPPEYRDSLTKYEAATSAGCVNCWEYHPNHHLQVQQTMARSLKSQVNVPMPARTSSIISNSLAVNDATTLSSVETFNDNQIGFDYATTIFFGNTSSHGDDEHRKLGRILPKEYIAFLPPNTVAGTCQPIAMHLSVTTEIDIGFNVDTTYSSNAITSVAGFAGIDEFPTAKQMYAKNLYPQSNNPQGTYCGQGTYKIVNV